MYFNYAFDITKKAVQDFVELCKERGLKITNQQAREYYLPVLLRQMTPASIQVSDDLADKLTLFLPDQNPSIAVFVETKKIVVRRILNASIIDSYEYIQKIAEEILPVPSPPLDMKKVTFSPHSIERFTKRFQPKDRDVEKSIRAVLIRSQEEKIIPAKRVKDIILGRHEETRYFKTDNGKFRFVVAEKDGQYRVITFKAV